MQKSLHSNNFDCLRIVAAFMVLWSHQLFLMGRPEWVMTFSGFPELHTLGGYGVLVFFSISGYLVAQSWQNDPHPVRFMAKRILRIWPGLIVVVTLAALVMGPLVSTMPAREYFSDPLFLQYFSALHMRIKFLLPGVFNDNPYPSSVNGSLWTLPIEFYWYLVLMVLGLIGALRSRWLVLAMLVAAAIYLFVYREGHNTEHRSFTSEFGIFFCFGIFLNSFKSFWRPRKLQVLTGLFGMAAAFLWLGEIYIAVLLVLPATVVFFGEASTPGLRRAGRYGDLSYGLYIYAFPVQQLVIMLTDNRWSFAASLSTVTVITVVLAYLSWHLVEQPALGLKKYFDFRPAPASHAEALSR